MKNEPFIIERTYNAPVEKVWKAITDRDQMKEWYFDLAQFKAVVGFEFKFDGGTKEKTYVHLCKITDVEVNKKLRYSWRYEGYEGISYVTFELFPEGNRTRLKLTHENLESFEVNNNPDLGKKSFAAGWNDIIGNQLKNYVEKA